MPSVWVPTLISIAIISLVSLVGLLTIPFHFLRRHSLLFALIALAAGTLIGDTFFHLLPEAAELWGEFGLPLGALVIAGFLSFYLIESVLRIGHAHGEAQHEPHDAPLMPAMGHMMARPAGSSGPSATAQLRPSPPSASSHSPASGILPFGILNLVGDAVHNFLDGVVVAAAFLVDTPTGVATAMAVAAHEIPQEFGDFGVLLRAGFPPLKAAALNLMSAVFAFGGAALILALPFETVTLERFALPLVAGGFLYIAAADLVPELHHHTRPRYIPAVVVLLVAGVGLMAALTLLE